MHILGIARNSTKRRTREKGADQRREDYLVQDHPKLQINEVYAWNSLLPQHHNIEILVQSDHRMTSLGTELIPTNALRLSKRPKQEFHASGTEYLPSEERKRQP
jgi:hypothetical protein